ncbi:MAG: PAS domain-containing sensor histidine kinase [Ferruginibacter sp.]|nr:PAS domain-containing sensor histidine kinase [Cytophagales bacterium]
MLYNSGVSAPSFLRQFAEQSDLVVFAYEVESDRFTYLNPAFQRVFARSPDSLRSADALLSLVHGEDQAYLREIYGQLLAGEIKKNVECRILLPDNSERWVQIRPFLLKEQPGQRIITGSVEDITDWKHYIDVETRHTNKKNTILQILSHDLAGPLGNIQALSALVTTRVRHYQDAELDKVMGLITETSERSVRLIREFVSREFLESSETALIRSRVNIVEKIREVTDQYQHSQQNSAKTFTLASPDPAIYVGIDEAKFMQVIINLISNSVKFTADDGVITVGLNDRGASLLVTVEDNGVGIPRKYHACLFDKFTKAGRPGLRNEPSVGLGMSIIKTIVEWHDGQIWFESEENKGTRFFIEIPKE